MPKRAWTPKRERQYEYIKQGLLEHGKGEGERTYDQLYNEARERGIEGRSRMTKRQLEDVLKR